MTKIEAAIKAGELKQCPHCQLYFSPTNRRHECMEMLRTKLYNLKITSEGVVGAFHGEIPFSVASQIKELERCLEDTP